MYSLYEVFEELPEPRSPLGRRHPLSAILSQATVAKDIAIVAAKLNVDAVDALDRLRFREVGELERVRDEAWARFADSRLDKKTGRIEKTAPSIGKDGKPVGGETKEIQTVEPHAAGDPRWMKIALDSNERICKLMGLDLAPAVANGLPPPVEANPGDTLVIKVRDRGK